MKMVDAMKIIQNESTGFMVHFDKCGDGFLRSDSFPEKHAGEELIKTEAEAWILASKFAEKTYGECVNIYVTDGKYNPVDGYEARKLNNRD